MGRLYDNFVDGTTSADITSSDTVFASAGLADLVAISGADFVYVTLDADGSGGAPEVVKISAHVAAATNCTITRAQLGTTARSHVAGTDWTAGAYDSDFQRIDTLDSQVAALQAGNTSDDTRLDLIEGDNWVSTPRIADSAVSAAKIAAGAVTTLQLDSNSVSTPKIIDGNVTYAKLAAPTEVLLRRVAALSIGSGFAVDITWDTEDADTSGFIAAPGTHLLTPAGLSGVYVGHLHVTAASTASFQVWAGIGAKRFVSPPLATSGAFYPEITMPLDTRIAASDSLTFTIYNFTGSSVNFTARLELFRVAL